jgi:hypothetical protein
LTVPGGSGIVWESDTLSPGLKAFPDRVRSAVERVMDYSAQRTEDYAKGNAPWTDQTGNARNTLRAYANHGEVEYIELSHGVPYGIWLEVRFEGRYAIIIPTIKVMGREVMSSLRNLLGKMPG